MTTRERESCLKPVFCFRASENCDMKPCCGITSRRWRVGIRCNENQVTGICLTVLDGLILFNWNWHGWSFLYGTKVLPQWSFDSLGYANSEFFDKVGQVLERIPPTYFIVLVEEFKAHPRNDRHTWDMIGRNNLPDLNQSDEMLLDLL